VRASIKAIPVAPESYRGVKVSMTLIAYYLSYHFDVPHLAISHAARFYFMHEMMV
jgi:hypothetical protein